MNTDWMKYGTALFLDAVDRLPDEALSAPTPLAGWTRRHVVAHLAANAEALSNLVHWARTGEVTPAYASPQARDAGIEAGIRRPTADLRAWVYRSAADLAGGLAALTEAQWSRKVRTAQGRTVPATQIPWLRSREVMVHAVDLDAGTGFADLPVDFLAALTDDITAKRSQAPGPALRLTASDLGRTWTVAGTGQPVPVHGPLAELAAYLAGRPYSTITAPTLPRWL